MFNTTLKKSEARYKLSHLFFDCIRRDGNSAYKAGFPLGEFVRANKQKANVIGW